RGGGKDSGGGNQGGWLRGGGVPPPALHGCGPYRGRSDAARLLPRSAKRARPGVRLEDPVGDAMIVDERYHHRRPFNKPFYDAIAEGLAGGRWPAPPQNPPPAPLTHPPRTPPPPPPPPTSPA